MLIRIGKHHEYRPTDNTRYGKLEYKYRYPVPYRTVNITVHSVQYHQYDTVPVPVPFYRKLFYKSSVADP